MGIVSGTLSYLRFSLQVPSDGFEQSFCEALEQHAFREIDATSDVEKAAGWVRFEDAFSSEWDARTLVDHSGYLLLRLRVDTLKIPAGTLKAYTEREARERCHELKRDKLVRRELDVIKLEVKQRLRKRSLPKMQLLEVVWNIATGELRLMSTSKAAASLFTDLFEKTFGMPLRPVGLLTVLWLRGMSEPEIDALAALEPERLHLIRS